MMTHNKHFNTRPLFLKYYLKTNIKKHEPKIKKIDKIIILN